MLKEGLQPQLLVSNRNGFGDRVRLGLDIHDSPLYYVSIYFTI